MHVRWDFDASNVLTRKMSELDKHQIRTLALYIVTILKHKVNIQLITLSCLPIYPMPSLKVFYQNLDYYNELNIYQKVLNEFRPNFAETW